MANRKILDIHATIVKKKAGKYEVCIKHGKGKKKCRDEKTESDARVDVSNEVIR